MQVVDLARPVLWRDDETGETIPGGEDSPRADQMRRELDQKRRKRLSGRYNKASSLQTISNE